jgi:hypothetical protein
MESVDEQLLAMRSKIRALEFVIESHLIASGQPTLQAVLHTFRQISEHSSALLLASPAPDAAVQRNQAALDEQLQRLELLQRHAPPTPP